MAARVSPSSASVARSRSRCRTATTTAGQDQAGDERRQRARLGTGAGQREREHHGPRPAQAAATQHVGGDRRAGPATAARTSGTGSAPRPWTLPKAPVAVPSASGVATTATAPPSAPAHHCRRLRGPARATTTTITPQIGTIHRRSSTTIGRDLGDHAGGGDVGVGEVVVAQGVAGELRHLERNRPGHLAHQREVVHEVLVVGRGGRRQRARVPERVVGHHHGDQRRRPRSRTRAGAVTGAGPPGCASADAAAARPRRAR